MVNCNAIQLKAKIPLSLARSTIQNRGVARGGLQGSGQFIDSRHHLHGLVGTGLLKCILFTN